MGVMICPVCSSKNVAGDIPDAKDYLTGDLFAIEACRDCGVAFTRFDAPSMDKYYPPFYRRYSPAVLKVLRFFYKRRVMSWMKNKKPGKVLEFGCGDGYMLSEFQRQGWDVLGVERTESDAKQAGMVSKVPVVFGDLMSLQSKLATYDMIVLFHSFEHVTDPARVLSACYEHLKADGEIVVAVPNYASWQARFCGKHWLHLDPPRHLFHYTPQSLKAMLGKAGFSQCVFSYVSVEHDPYGWEQSLLNMVGFPQGAMTEGLMRSSRLSVSRVVMMLVAAALVLPSLLLAGASWIAGRGALMEVRARKTAGSAGSESNP